MRFRNITFLVLLAAAATAAYAALSVSELPKAEARAQAGWQAVEQEFRRRAEFVPAVITAIEAINPAQKDLIGKVQTAQAQVLSLPADPAAPASSQRFQAFMKVQDTLSESLGDVMDMLRVYPDKGRSPPVRKVFDELELKETRIVVARSNYVAEAVQHNNLITTPPTAWVTALMYPQAKPLVASFDSGKP